ncbi:TRAP transporter substrate-binding protein [uncultured Mailhella sp.]|uniref:TRAP transporter substrate-binding protein n=1 Tax=uncultured Mailhella sp. TaxID=1981031 RepID=UPI002637A4E0|nr:TRAP transporter substrate-binding protein [uncultured Mailhella sp.]
MNKIFAFMMGLALTFCASLPAQAADYVLSLNLAIAPVHNRWTMALKPWADEITRRSEGRIVIEPYFAQALSKQAEVVESVVTGVADMGEATFTVGGLGRYPFHEQILNLVKPSLCTVDSADLVKSLHAAFPTEAMKDVAGTKLLFVEGHTMGMLIGTRDKPIRKLEDLKGMKIGVSGGGIRVERVKALGATVVGISIPDMYMSLEKGVIDGAVVDCEVLVSRKLGDIIKNLTLLNMGGSVFYCVMNKDVYDSMPADLQKIVDEVSGEYASKLFNDFWNNMQYNSLEKWQKEQGGKLFMLSQADYAEADRLVEPTYAQWIEFTRGKGLPAEAMLAKFRELENRDMKPWAESRAVSSVTR